MKRFPMIMGLVLLCLFSSGQNPAWSLPGNYLNYLPNNSFSYPGLPSPSTLCNAGVTPNQPGFPLDGYDGQLADYASNMMLNPQGEVEFFIVDGIIYDGEGNYINSMSISGGQLATGASEMVIVPDPANCDRYYLIAAAVTQSIYKKVPYVFLLDMSLPNEQVCNDCSHFGALVLQNCPGSNFQDYALPVSCVESATIPPDPSPGKISNCFIAASELQQGSFHWVFISNTWGIFRFKIDANGFNYDNHYISFPNASFNPYNIRSEMELVSLPGGGFRIAAPYQYEGGIFNNVGIWEMLFVAELDANGNYINTTQDLFPMYQVLSGGTSDRAALKGIEFSENGDRIYVTHTTNSQQPNAMEYYEFGTSPVQLQPFNIPGNIDAEFAGLELAEGDKLILANQNGLYQLPNATTAQPSDMSLMWATNLTPTYEGIQGFDMTKMYSLPDQIDGMDYGASFFSSVACCMSSYVFEGDVFTASSGAWSPNTTQNGGNNPLQSNISPDIHIKKELRIPAGVDVTINNMNLRFAPGAHLVIENGSNGQQGGKLTLNNTLLTVDDRCDEAAYWLGVEVWGNTNVSQGNLNNTTQGQLLMQDNSQIEHAQIGVLVGRRNVTLISQGNNCPPKITVQPFGFDYSRAGGIVRSEKSRFFGNQRGVYYFPYLAGNGSNNLGRYSETDFAWDGPLHGNLSPQVHAYLREVKGINFLGSSFRNVTPSAFNDNQLGTGIFSYQSQFYVNPKCPQPTLPCTVCPGEIKSSFENLRFGVRTYNFNNNLTFSVRRSDFDNCQYGAYVYGTQNERLFQNSIKVRQASYQTAGIALFRSPRFRVEENTIEGIGNAAGSNSYGIVVNSSGETDNDVYRNHFKDLHIGGQSELKNAVEINANNYPGSNPFNMSGLNWTCNTFESGIETADLTVVNGEIDYFQGHAIGHSSIPEAVNGSARNYFSLHGEPMSPAHDLLVSGNITQGFQYVGLNTPYVYADSYTASWVLPLISSFGGNPVVATPGMCPSKCIGKLAAQAKRVQLQLELDDLAAQLRDPDLTGRDRELLEARVRPVQEELNLIEQQMISDALMEYESLEDLEVTLEDINTEDLLGELSQTFSQDLSEGSNEPNVSTPESFLPLEPAGEPGRKMMTPQLSIDLDFEVYPNPGQGQVELLFHGNPPEQLDVLVVDLMGRTVYQQSLDNGNHKLNLTQLSPGVYNMVLFQGNASIGNRKLEILR